MYLARYAGLALLAGSLTVLGCGGTTESGEAGTGGFAGAGGAGGSAGAGGSGGSGGVDITPGIWTYWIGTQSVCLFVNEDATALVADGQCSQNGIDLASWAFEFRTNTVDVSCGLAYPMDGEVPQEVPIVNNSFMIETMRGDTLVKFGGTFTASNAVSGTASSWNETLMLGCPMDMPWSASPGLCSRCW